MHPEDSLDSLIATGLIKSPEKTIQLTDEPKIPSYACFPSDYAEKNYNTTAQLGNGFDIKKISAKIKSAGECLERLCLYNPQEEKFLIAKYDRDKKFVDPALFFSYSEQQIKNREKYLEKLRSSELKWYPSKDISSGESLFIPGQSVFLSHDFEDENQIRKEMISTGAAFGPRDTNLAFKTGLLESIERDCTTTSYLKKEELPRIEDLPSEISELKDYLKRYQLESHIFDASNDLKVPTSIVATIDRSGEGPALCVGASSDLTYYEAIKKALLESIQWRGISRLIRDFQINELPGEDEVTSMTNRFFYWYTPERINNLNFWIDSSESIRYEELSEKNISLDKIISTLGSKGYHILSTDISLPETEEKGFEGVKVLVPELHPLYLDERAKALYSVHHGSLPDRKDIKPHPIA